MHCDDSEPFCHTLRSKYAGLGVSSLQKSYYFACSTPQLSPPTISTSLPTHVQTTTVKYMQPFLKERKLQDPLPSSWKLPAEPLKIDSLVEIDKNSLHVYDGDSAEVELPDEHNCPNKLRQLGTDSNPGTIRIRMLHQDAPEVKFSVRIYKQSAGSTHMTPIVTRHIGIESLRALREIVFDAKSVYLQVPTDSDGKITVSLDLYGRRLMNIFVEDNKGTIKNVTEVLASQGHTLSYYTNGIESNVNAKMRDAITNGRGIFNLPEEVFVYPFRPWDLRKLWPDTQASQPPAPYEEYRPISNAPPQPESVWRSTTMRNPEDETELLEDSSQGGDLFFFKIVPTSMQNESLCFKAPSKIAGAGQGLFLKPHPRLIPKGSHLCLYAEQPTTELEMDQRHSSRDYAIETSKRGVWYDAEREQANNLGRFANQPGVLEMLLEIKKRSERQNHAQIGESDWKFVEDQLIELCNAEYRTAGQEMVVCAKRDLQPTRKPEEILTYYGGLRTYWLKAIVESPLNSYSGELGEIVHWLMTSPDCNWTAEQRSQWMKL